MDCMSSGREQAKLAQLRARTDQQLLGLVYTELETALRSESGGNYPQAARAYVEATRLLPLLENISAVERARLEARLDIIRDRISEEAASAASIC
jgi:hypothetical protein